MSRIRSATGGGLFVASALVLLASGCGQAEPVAYAPPPPVPSQGTYGSYAATPETGTEPVATDLGPALGTDLAYEPAPPVGDIEEYPSVVYEGAPVYFVGGTWYRHDARGWGEYRREPRELATQRGEHERDPRWVQAARRPPSPVARPGAIERRAGTEERGGPPRQGVTERQAPPPIEQAPRAPRPEAQPQPARRGPPASASPAQRLSPPHAEPAQPPAQPAQRAQPPAQHAQPTHAIPPAPRGGPPAAGPRPAPPPPPPEHR